MALPATSPAVAGLLFLPWLTPPCCPLVRPFPPLSFFSHFSLLPSPSPNLPPLCLSHFSSVLPTPPIAQTPVRFLPLSTPSLPCATNNRTPFLVFLPSRVHIACPILTPRFFYSAQVLFLVAPYFRPSSVNITRDTPFPTVVPS